MSSFELGSRDKANTASQEARAESRRETFIGLHPALVISRESDGTHTIGIYDSQGNLCAYYSGVDAWPKQEFDADEEVVAWFTPGEAIPAILSASGGAIDVTLIGMIFD